MCYHFSAQTTITAVAQTLAPHWSSLLHLTASGKHHESLALIVSYVHILISHCSSKAFRCRQGLWSETRTRNGIRGCDSRPGTQFTNMLLLSHSHLFFSMLFPPPVLKMFAVYPLSWCQHLEEIAALPEKGLDTSAVCEACDVVRENWVCLSCFHVSA